jgi:hypothetical protein
MPQAAIPGKQHNRRYIVHAIILIALLATIRLADRAFKQMRTEVMLAGLHSPATETRKTAAWDSIARPDPRLRAVLVAGVQGGDSVDDVRESFVYALGRIGDKRDMSAIESAIDLDSSGLVRAAAWLAAARIDPAHFRTLAASAKPAAGDWDRLGLAQAWLLLGDVRGIATLLRVTRESDQPQSVVATRALKRDLLPILDSVGQCPAAERGLEDTAWSPSLVAEIERRCSAMPLQRVSDDLQQHRAASNSFRRDLQRITTGRDQIARWLFGSNRAKQ